MVEYFEGITNANLVLLERYKEMIGDKHPEASQMIESFITNIDSMPIDKQSRWMGYLQCGIINDGYTTVEEERNFSRGLFTAVYDKCGLNYKSITVGEEDE